MEIWRQIGKAGGRREIKAVFKLVLVRSSLRLVLGHES